MQTNPKFIVVNVLRSNKNDKNSIREETLPVDDIKGARRWHNKGKNGIDSNLPLTQVTLRTARIPDEEEKEEREHEEIQKKDFKMLIVEDFDEFNKKLGAIKVSEIERVG